MEGVAEYEGIFLKKGSATKVVDPLTVEQALEISINQKPFTVVMQTPGDEIELATGLLFAEDVMGKNAQAKIDTSRNDLGFIEKINFQLDPTELGDGYLSARSLLSVSSCGICGKQSLEDLQIQHPQLSENKQAHTCWKASDLMVLQEKMMVAQTNFKKTGGCHGVAAFNAAGELLTLKEDIGRHNAMDKVIGQLIIQKKMNEAKLIFFSGRVSYEIVSKAFRAKIPLIMAVSAPSSLAVDFAKEYGITLLAFSREGRTTCYANCSFVGV